MTLETAGGIAGIAAIIIDAVSIFLRLFNQIQEIPQALDDLQADIDRLEKAVTLLRDAKNNQRQIHPQNIPTGANGIVDVFQNLCSKFATEVDQRAQNRFIFGYNWKFMYLVFFQQRRMRNISKCIQICLLEISVVASIAAWHDLIRHASITGEMRTTMSANQTETNHNLDALEQHIAALTKKLEKMESGIDMENERHRQSTSRQQKQADKMLDVLMGIVTDDRKRFQGRASAAKDAEQHVALEKGTTELQTGHGDSETLVDDQTV